MKKLMVLLALLALMLDPTTEPSDKIKDTRSIPEKIMDTVVITDMSSGIVIYSDCEHALILTAYHVVSDHIEDKNFTVDYMFISPTGPISATFINHRVNKIIYDEKSDLAIVEIATDRILDSIEISSESPRLGDDIWIGANPNYVYRSLKKGIVGSIKRVVNDTRSFEISGGVINGSSGGGAFTKDGKLFGIIKSMKVRRSNQCYDKYDDAGYYVGKHCIFIPIESLGFTTTTDQIIKFVIDSEYHIHFDYLK